jgi:hypothetical protein
MSKFKVGDNVIVVKEHPYLAHHFPIATRYIVRSIALSPTNGYWIYGEEFGIAEQFLDFDWIIDTPLYKAMSEEL